MQPSITSNNHGCHLLLAKGLIMDSAGHISQSAVPDSAGHCYLEQPREWTSGRESGTLPVVSPHSVRGFGNHPTDRHTSSISAGNIKKTNQHVPALLPATLSLGGLASHAPRAPRSVPTGGSLPHQLPLAAFVVHTWQTHALPPYLSLLNPNKPPREGKCNTNLIQKQG